MIKMTGNVSHGFPGPYVMLTGHPTKMDYSFIYTTHGVGTTVTINDSLKTYGKKRQKRCLCTTGERSTKSNFYGQRGDIKNG